MVLLSYTRFLLTEYEIKIEKFWVWTIKFSKNSQHLPDNQLCRKRIYLKKSLQPFVKTPIKALKTKFEERDIPWRTNLYKCLHKDFNKQL